MTIFKQAVVELILLTVASVGVALAANEIRERKSIELTKNYFERGSGAPRKAGEQPPKGEVPPSTPAPNTPNVGKTAETAKPVLETAQAATKKHIEHDFQSISLEEVQKVFEDPQTAQGLNIFVDARDDEHFAEGHIPGAMQCFPYESRRCLDRVTASADGADKVIVYCGGVDCEDSIFMCRELTEAGVPFEAVYLFEGGWKEWSARGLPTGEGK